MRQKIFLILFGLLISVFITEAFLRLTGFLYYRERMRKEYSFISNKMMEEEDNHFTKFGFREDISAQGIDLVKIMCVGDSWTFGQGAHPGYSYPAQLQMLLSKEHPNRYKVYNCGVPGCTSGKLLRYLPKFLEKYKPDIVIILIGANDMQNPWLSELMSFSASSKDSYRWKNFIMDFRVLKLIKFCWSGLKEKIKAFREPKLEFKKDINIKSYHESEKYVQLGFALFHAGKVELAKDYYQKALEMNPSNEMGLLHLGHLYLSIREYNKGLDIFKRLLQLNPYSQLRQTVYQHLFNLYQNPITLRDRIELLIKDIPSDKTFQNPGMPFVLNQEEKIINNFQDNLERIIALIRSKRAMPIFQTYLRPYPAIDSLVSSFAKNHNIPLVENGKSLEGLLDISSYFAPERHPNENGYRLVAENVHKILEEVSHLNQQMLVNGN